MTGRYKYYCKKCNITVTHNAPGYAECPKCKTGDHLVDHGDYGDYDSDLYGGGFNWNKK